MEHQPTLTVHEERTIIQYIQDYTTPRASHSQPCWNSSNIRFDPIVQFLCYGPGSSRFSSLGPSRPVPPPTRPIDQAEPAIPGVHSLRVLEVNAALPSSLQRKTVPHENAPAMARNLPSARMECVGTTAGSADSIHSTAARPPSHLYIAPTRESCQMRPQLPRQRKYCTSPSRDRGI